MNRKNISIGIIAIILLVAFFTLNKSQRLPIVAIANYGPHASLQAAMAGLKEELAKQGFIDQRTIRYQIADVGFDPALIPQMVTKLMHPRPKVMVVLTTPVAQFAKGKIADIPLVYAAITDPVAARLIKKVDQASGNITGSSDKQDLEAFLQFARRILPHAKTVGLFYATSESNDLALVNMMRSAAATMGMSVVAIPIDQATDIPLRIQAFKGKVDLIYVGTSGPIQPALPAISSAARNMKIPVFNVEEKAVYDGLALASFGVDYRAVGKNAGKLVAAVLNGQDIRQLAPIYPDSASYRSVINKKNADALGVDIPPHITVVGQS